MYICIYDIYVFIRWCLQQIEANQLRTPCTALFFNIHVRHYQFFVFCFQLLWNVWSQAKERLKASSDSHRHCSNLMDTTYAQALSMTRLCALHELRHWIYNLYGGVHCIYAYIITLLCYVASVLADTVPWHTASFCAINSEPHTLSRDVADSAKLALILAAGWLDCITFSNELAQRYVACGVSIDVELGGLSWIR